MGQDEIRAELKGLHSPDAPHLDQFEPEGPFGILVQAMVGPSGQPGKESFDMVVCTTDWFAANMLEEVVPGRHYLFVKEFDYRRLWNYLEEYCKSCSGSSWREAADKVGRIGKWEFEDYREFS